MYPVLFKFGKFSIYTYGFLIAAGFLAGVFLAGKEAKRLGDDPDKMMDLCFYLLIAAIVGARLFYVVTTPEIFLSDPLEFFRIWNGGLVFYGGFLGALAAALVYLRIHRMNIWKTIDILAPSVALGQFFGRLGCFFAGCCYGKTCSLPWAVTFTHPGSLAPLHVSLHPSQLYHAAGNLIIFLLLWFGRHRKRFDGQLFWAYVGMYGISRGFLEIFRGDYRGESFFGVLSISQVIGGVMALAAAVALFSPGRKKTPTAHRTP